MYYKNYVARFLGLFVVLLLSLCTSAQTFSCSRLYVDSTVVVSGNGSSWGTAFKTLSQALDSANSGSCSSREIWVAKGTYYATAPAVTQSVRRDSAFRIQRNGVKLYGGFAGGETTLSARSVSVNPTVLSGDIGFAGDSTDNSFHVVTVVSNNTVDTSTRIDGFTIKEGNATYSANGTTSFIIAGQTISQFRGSGIYCISSGPTIANCTLTSNNSLQYGGGMYNVGAAPVLTNCVFTRNSGSQGGAIYNNYTSSMKATGCSFSLNRGVSYGGGVYNDYYSTSSFFNCSFTSNTSTRGGAMANENCAPLITGCTFAANTGSNSGAGIYNNNSATPLIANCTFTTNNSMGEGGGIYNSASPATISSCIFSGNTSTHGGGIYNADTGSAITNCLFVANSSTYGGGIYNGNSSPKVTNSTFYGNSAVYGGSMCNSGAPPDVINSVFWNNTGNGGISIYNLYTAPPAFHYCISEVLQAGASNGSGNSNTSGNPQFADSANAIGPDGIWRTADDGLRLQTGSSGINTGNSFAVPAGINTDIAGAARFTGGYVDRGAYEWGAFPCMAAGSIVYVDSSIAVSGNGATWATAYKTVAEGLDAANSCLGVAQVWVAKGTYYPMSGVNTVATSRDVSLLVQRNGVKLYGGFAGGETTLLARNVAANPTVLSGDIGVPGVSNDNSFHVVTILSSTTIFGNVSIDSTTRLDGFTITAGNANASYLVPYYINGKPVSRGNGGGIHIAAAAPTIVNCTFKRNNSEYGSGVYNNLSAPFISDCVFTLNTGYMGGGMYNNASSPTVTNCTFSNDTLASPGYSGYGAGMYNYTSSPQITNCTFSANSSSDGGGMYNNNTSNPQIDSCIFINNKAGVGGGIYNNFSSPVITNCTFTANTTGSAAGAIYNTYAASAPQIKNCIFTSNSSYSGGAIGNSFSCSPAITNCVFYLNYGYSSGGAISNASSGTAVTNCVFYANTAGSGGAMLISGSAPAITNCTFYGNSCGSWGGSAISLDVGSPTIKNCLFWGNTGYPGVSIYGGFTGNYPIINYTTTETPQQGAGNNIANPLFINAANPKGADSTWGTADDGLQLTTCSPAINTGFNAAVPAAITTDITAAIRIQNTTVDRGAYEMPYNSTGVSVTTITRSPATPVCGNAVINFTATTTVPGSVPVYQWYRNGIAVGTGQTTYSFNSWSNGDSVWIVHTNNNCGVNDTSVKMIIPVVPPLPQPSPIATGSNPCLSTQTYSVVAVPSATSYTWVVPASWTITAGQGTAAITVAITNTAGSVSVTANDSCGVASVARTLPVTPFVVPNTPAVPAGPVAVCASSTNIYSTTAVPGAATYTWTVPTGWVITAGQGNATIATTAAAGNSSGAITVTAGNICQTSSSATLAVTGGTFPPTIAVSKNTDDTICAGTPVTFTATTTFGGTTPNYQWKKNGLNVGSNTAGYTDATLANSDAITVTLTSTSLCAATPTVTSGALVFTVNPTITPVLTVTANPSTSVPAGSTVSFTATVSAGSAGATYQWYKNSNAISGANSSTYTTNTLVGGDLIVVGVSGLGPCASSSFLASSPLRISDPAGIKNIVGGGGNWQESIFLHPNPNSGRFTVTADWGTISAGEKVQLEVINYLGQPVYHTTITLKEAKWSGEIELAESVANGLYLLRMKRQSNGSIITKPLTVQR